MFQFNYGSASATKPVFNSKPSNSLQIQPNPGRRSSVIGGGTEKSPIRSSTTQKFGSKIDVGKQHSIPLHHSPSSLDNCEEMLMKLVDEAETNLVAYSEETVDHPADSLHGVALCNSTDDVRLINWQIDLLNSQLVMKGAGKAGFILVTAARASVTQKFHHPIWRNAQLLLKRSWTSTLSGMQYFAPLVIGENSTRSEEPQFRWLSREVIEEKALSDPSVNDKVNNYSATGEAVGGVVSDPANQLSPHPELLQLQRVASRCSCQLFFCYFSDVINMEKLEDIAVPSMDQTNDNTWRRKFEEVDCFTLKHNMLEISTNSEQYQMILEIVNKLLLFVDPKKTQAEENRRRLWFKLGKKSRQLIKEKIQKMQSELREEVSIVRSLERQSFFLNKELVSAPDNST
uniref:BLTP2/FMP27/Hobbit C-terminal domain-containing protein n=1 Tax=Ditylenchus dipsaci TaxID=166011 RepID=A0A915DHJ3_9BILA